MMSSRSRSVGPFSRGLTYSIAKLSLLFLLHHNHRHSIFSGRHQEQDKKNIASSSSSLFFALRPMSGG